MKRRDFLIRTGLGAAAVAIGDRASALAQPSAEAAWRTFELTTRVEVLEASNRTRVWLPTPLPSAPYQQTGGDRGNVDTGDTMRRLRQQIDLILRAEHGRWIVFSLDRLHQFGYRFDTF